MIVNIFNKSNEKNEFEEKIEKIEKYNEAEIYRDIQEYLVSNYLYFLQNNDVGLIKEKIKERLTNKYSLIDLKKQNILVNEITSKIFGYDILQKYIDNEEVSDIRVVAWNKIYIKRLGNWELVEESFEDKDSYEQYIKYVVIKNGGKLNFEYPVVTISDRNYNLRIEAGIIPVNVSSPSLIIRIHRHSKSLDLEKLMLQHEMYNTDIYKFLKYIIKEKLNVIIAGKGGSGKTSLLRAMINNMDDSLAIVTNEETCELYIENKNIIQREIINNRQEDKNITLEKLSLHSLVMANDVIIIGEIKRKRKFSIF